MHDIQKNIISALMYNFMGSKLKQLAHIITLNF